MESVGLIIIIGVSFSMLVLALGSMAKKITEELSRIGQSLDKILRHLDEKNDQKEE